MAVYRFVVRGWLGGLILLFGIQACSPFMSSNWGVFPLDWFRRVRSVESIDTPSAAGQTVSLQGTVGDRIPLIDGQVYQLHDDSGSIWVLTSDSQLQSGDRVRILGEVRVQDFPELGPELGQDAHDIYIHELDQLEPRVDE
ncbi:MAG: hypothetical protein ACFE0I_12460 [Elainellaceae cyanobacterium]